MLSYLQSLTQTEILIVVHKCAQFSNNPQLMHESAERWIGKYLENMFTFMDLLDVTLFLSTRGVLHKPMKEKGVECCANDNFDGG